MKRIIYILSGIAILGSLGLAGVWWRNTSRTIAAAHTNPNAPGRITLTFDDGHDSDLAVAAPILQRYGLNGTAYIIPGFVGRQGYMNWSQIHSLQSAYHWEIGSHTVHHRDLSQLSVTDMQHELADSQSALKQRGFPATEFASPQGDYNTPALAMIARYYGSHRAFKDSDDNDSPYNNYLLYTMHLDTSTPIATIRSKIDRAIAQHHWLILTFHGVRHHPDTDPHVFDSSAATFTQIADYIHAKQSQGLLRPISIADGRSLAGSNLLANGTFDQPLADGWNTDTPKQVFIDHTDHGSFPSAHDAVQLNGGQSEVHLFSKQVDVTSETDYMISSFLHTAHMPHGEVTYYIDEYDASGAWISGKTARSEHTEFAEQMNFIYRASSKQVHSARLQISVTGPQTVAYVDSVQWLAPH